MGFEPMTSASRCSVLSSELSSQLWGGGGGGHFVNTCILRVCYELFIFYKMKESPNMKQ